MLLLTLGLGLSIGLTAPARPSISVRVNGPGSVAVVTRYHRQTRRYTVTTKSTTRLTAGTRVTLTEHTTGGALFAGWSGGGCAASRASCVVTVRTAVTISARFRVRAAPTATKTTITCTSVTYDGLAQAPCSSKVTGQGGLNKVLAVVYGGDHTRAGTIAVTASFPGDATHAKSSAASHFSIAKAALTVTPDARSVIYGAAVPTYTFSVTGFQNAETATTASGYVAPTCQSTYSPTTSVSSSPLVIGCTGGSAGNYSFTTSATASLTIGKAGQAISGFSPESSGTVGDTYNLATAGAAGGASGSPIVYTIDSTTANDGTTNQACSLGTDGTTLSFDHNGSCVVDANQAGNANYAAATQVQANVAVGHSTPTITTPPTASAITYGQTLAGSSLLGGVASVPGVFSFTAPTTAPGAGTPSEGVTFTPTNTADYTALTTSVSVTVNKATLYVVPNAQSVAYGASVPTYSFTYYSDAAHTTKATPAVGTSPTCTSPYTTSTSVSASPVTIACSGGSDTNYAFNDTATAPLTVTEVTPAITTLPTAAAITYGQTLASSSLSGGVASVGGLFTFTTPSTSPGAGTPLESVTFTPTDVTDYTTVTTSVSISVAKATLYVVPNNQQITFSAPLPGASFYTFTYHSGYGQGPLVTPTMTGTAPTCTSSYYVGLTAGTYPSTITCSGGTDPNYIFDYSVTADLTVS